MRTILLVAAISAALAIPIVSYREPPVPLATTEQQDEIDPVVEMAASGCKPIVQHVDDDWSLVRLCAFHGE